MIDRLARQPYAVYLLLAAYFIVNIAVRLSTPASLELDEGQQLFLAQWFVSGYDNQPPFYNWLQYVAVQLLGDTVLSLSLLKNTILFCSYLLFGLTANLVIRDRALAVIATLGLITIPQVAFEAQRDLTHSVALMFATALFAYALVRTVKWPTAVNYGLTGLAIGIGMLSKYNFALLPVSVLIVLASDRQLRARLLDLRVLITISVAGVVAAPHALWVLGHIAEATGMTLQKLQRGVGGDPDQMAGVLALAEALVAVMLPTLAVFFLAFGRTLPRAWRAQSPWTRLIGRTLLVAVVLVLLLIVSGFASYIRHRWLLPLALLLPLYLAAKLDASGATVEAGSGNRFWAVVATIMVLVPVLLLARPHVDGLRATYGKQNVPYGPATQAILASGRDRPAIIVAGDRQLAGNLRLHAPDIPVVIPGYGELEKPFVFDATHPVLAVWRRVGQPAPKPGAGVRAWLDAKAGLAGKEPDTRDAALPYHYGREGDVYHFGYAWVYPAAGS